MEGRTENFTPRDKIHQVQQKQVSDLMGLHFYIRGQNLQSSDLENRYYNLPHSLLFGANPSALSYIASVVKIYGATNSMARFIIKILSLLCKNAPAYCRRFSLKFNSRRIGSRVPFRGEGKVAPNNRELH
jgi:hypothetical protein